MVERHACTVKVDGDIIDPQEYLNYTDVTYRIAELSDKGVGILLFTDPLNLTFVKEHFNEIFHVYYQNNTFFDHLYNSSVASFEIISISETNKAMEF